MKKKIVPIDISCHTYASIKAKQLKMGLAAFVELCIIEHGKTIPNEIERPESPNILPPVIQKAVGRPLSAKKPTWAMSSIEAKIMQIKDIPKYVPETESGIIKIETILDKLFFYPANDVTALLIEIAGEEQAMPVHRMKEINSINGMDNTIEVTMGYYPVNELSLKILSLMPGRELFSKELLFLFHKAGFSIKYID